MINWIKWLAIGVVSLLALLAIALYTGLRLSLPSLDGNKTTYHVSSPTELSRDSYGQAIVKADDIFDAAYALGFAHAQDRFFQMDLQRRSASGNLSQWVGKIALERDKNIRFHQFEQRARVVFDTLPTKQQELLVRYAHGVNDALDEMTLPPFEYIAAGVDIEQWRPTDSILVVYSMYLDLQGAQISFDMARTMLKSLHGDAVYDFMTQPSHFQAALDASEIAPYSQPVPPYPQSLAKNTLDTRMRLAYMGTELPDIGSNNWAVSGKLTNTGSAMLANDMHLSLRVPVIWYRAQLNYQEAGEKVQMTGVSLPGLPGIVVGTNDHIAWGFTNANLDNVDWVELNDDTPTQQYTRRISLPEGDHQYTIEVSQYGPVRKVDGKRYALNWAAHHPFAVNLGIVNMGTAKNVYDAIAIGKTVAIPTQNLVIVDKEGNSAWLPGGAVMQREYASYVAITESQMKENSPRRAQELPSVVNPSHGRIWTANARVISADDVPQLGDGGYALGARGQQIRDRLFEKDIFTENDFYAIQLDNHAQFLMPWHKLLSGLLKVQNVEFKQDLAYLNTWDACACEDSVGYTLVKHFRSEVIQTLFGSILTSIDRKGVNSRALLRQIEPAAWQLIHEQPDDWLPSDTESYDELLVDAYRRAKHKLLDAHSPVEADLETLRWGNVNALTVKHPFASQLPFIGKHLNMARVEGFGDTYMPAVQAPEFGASQRLFVSPGHLSDAILTLPGGQSGHPLSPYFTAGFDDYATQAATPLLPGAVEHTRMFYQKDNE